MAQICVKHIARGHVVGVRYIPKDIFCHILKLASRAEVEAVTQQQFYDPPIELPYLDQAINSRIRCVTPIMAQPYDEIAVEETVVQWYINQFSKIPRHASEQWVVTTVGEWSIQRRTTPPSGISNMHELHNAELTAFYEVDKLPLRAMQTGLFFGLSSYAKSFIDNGLTVYDSAVPSHSSMLLDMAAASTVQYDKTAADRLLAAADYSQSDDVYLVCQVGQIRIKHPESDVVMVLCDENYVERMFLFSYADAALNPFRNQNTATSWLNVRNSVDWCTSQLSITHPTLRHMFVLRTSKAEYPERPVKPLKLAVFQ